MLGLGDAPEMTREAAAAETPGGAPKTPKKPGEAASMPREAAAAAKTPGGAPKTPKKPGGAPEMPREAAAAAKTPGGAPKTPKKPGGATEMPREAAAAAKTPGGSPKTPGEAAEMPREAAAAQMPGDDAVQERWAGLPANLLHRIYRQLPRDRWYYGVLRSTCPAWRKVFEHLGIPPPRDPLPWLVECHSQILATHIVQNLQGDIRFHAPFANNAGGALRMPGDGFLRTIYNGPGNGELLLSSDDGRSLSLVNPLSATTKRLPNLPPGFLISRVGWSSHNSIYLVAISTKLSDLWSCVALLYDKDKEAWLQLKLEGEATYSTLYTKNALYKTTAHHATSVYDPISRDKIYEIQPMVAQHRGHCLTYLVQTSNELLRVSLVSPHEYSSAEQSQFHIHKLVSEDGGRIQKWAPVTRLDDVVIFLQMEMVGFSVNPAAGCAGNNIYFVYRDGKPYKCNIATGVVQQLGSPFTYNLWYKPPGM